MKKRIGSLLLTAIIITSIMPLEAFAADAGEIDKKNCQYVLIDNGDATEQLFGKSITNTSDFVRSESEEDESSYDAASNGVCGESLFWNLENGILTISGKGGAFDFTNASDAPWHYRVSEITSFVVETGVTIIPSGACYRCTNLTDVSIANSVTAIGEDAFWGCTSLESVSIPDSVNVLGMYAFFGCENLMTVMLGIGVNGLGYTVFGNTPSLTRINVASQNTYICSADGVVYNKDMSRLLYRPEANGESLIVPASVLGIAEGACKYSFTESAPQILLKEIRFEGDAPGFGTDCFEGITADAYYPENNDTWTASVMSNCSGNLKWIPYEAENFKIDIAKCDITISFNSAQWTGSPIRPEVMVKDNGTVLKEYTHYELEYADNRNVGTASVTVVGKRLYAGRTIKYFTITKADQMLELSIDFSIMEVGDRTQLHSISTRGAAYLTCVSDNPDVASIDRNRYITALSPGIAVITVTSDGNEYYNEVSSAITITVKEKETGPYDISECNIKMLTGSMTYTGYNREAVFSIYRRSTSLVKNRDYIVEYRDCVNAGTATAVITGIGDYTGSISYNYVILKAGQSVTAEISSPNILLGESAQIMANGIGDLSYITDDADIAVIDENGLVTGVGIGTVYIYVEASGDENHNASECAVVMEVSVPEVQGLVSIADCYCVLDTLIYTYDGTPKKPSAKVFYNDETLDEGSDYSILYTKNINAGYATAYIVGMNNYTGSSEPLTYTIERADQIIRIDNSSPIIIKVGESAAIISSGIGNIIFHTATANEVLEIGRETGIVTGLNPGSVEVYVSAGGDANYNPGFVTISVQVIADEEHPDPDIDNIYVLPQALSVLSEEAFAGNTQLQAVYAPEGAELTEICSGAFRNCLNLIEIELPGSVYSIASDAFEGCNNLFMIVSNDYCENYAENHMIPYIRK